MTKLLLVWLDEGAVYLRCPRCKQQWEFASDKRIHSRIFKQYKDHVIRHIKEKK